MKQVLQLSKVGLCGIVISCNALVGDVDVDVGPGPLDEGATAGAALPPLPSGPGSEADPSAIEGSECATGSFRCRGAQLDYCDGVHWLVWQACVSAALCESEPAGRCLPPACSIEQRRCSGAVFEGCNADATAWTTLETCESSAHCDAGTGCLTATCQEAQTRCNDGRVEVCQADDRGWSAVEECASAALCKEDLVSRAACAEPACDASEFRCAADGTGLVCNADRTGFVRCAGDDVPCTSECRQSETPPQDLPLDDVGSDGEGATAAEPAMPVCTFGPFQAAVRLTDDPAADYWSPSVTSNNLTVYFGGSRVGQAEHIFSTTRPSVDAQFIETTLTPGVNSPAAEGTAVESFDGLRLYFYSTRAGGQGDRDNAHR